MAITGCGGLCLREEESWFLQMLEIVGSNVQVSMQITALHSLAALKASINSEKHGVKEVLCSPTCKNSFALDHYRGFFYRNQYDPNEKYIRSNIMIQPAGKETTWIASDEFKREDYFFVDGMSSDDREMIEAVIKANELCRAAINNPNLHLRMEMVKKAQSVCPDHCPLYHLLCFESASVGEANSSYRRLVLAGRALCDAVETGRNLASLLQVNQFCEGNLFSYEPTRNYVRALYLHGSYLFYEGELEEAYDILQECLANDIHDKLGARHKQLLVVLEIGSTMEETHDNIRLRNLLKARFGDDQGIDGVLALWNYTRALYTFREKGDGKKSRQLLNHAIEKNPFVPMLLLRYESEEMGWGEHKVMSVGQISEANDYVQDNRHYWKQSEESLKWLEEMYANHSKAIKPKVNAAGARLLARANKLYATRESSNLVKATGKYMALLEIVGTKKKYSAVRLMALVNIGCCHKFLGNKDEAMGYFNDALSCQEDLKNNKDQHKEILYQIADFKENEGDFEGALDCYRIVFGKIGNFAIALQSVKRIEKKMGCKSGVIPASLDREHSSDDDEDIQKKIDEESHNDVIHHAFAETIKTYPEVTKKGYHEVVRCRLCKRGGVKLYICTLCKDDSVRYCSKACQTASWHKIHKYVCKGSKSKIDIGGVIVVKRFEKSPQINGMEGVVMGHSEGKEGFFVSLAESGSTVLLKPENMKKRAADSHNNS